MPNDLALDFNYDGYVNFDDLGAVAADFGVSITQPTDLTQGTAYAVSLPNETPNGSIVARWDLDWGDGEVDSYPAGVTTASHVYTQTGPFLLQMTALTDSGDVYEAPAQSFAVAPAGTVTTYNLTANPGDTINISADGNGNTIITDNGSTVETIATADLLTLAITGDTYGTLTVDFTNGDPLPVSGLSTDSALVDITGSSGSDTLFTTATAAIFGNAEIRYPASTALTFLNAGPGDQIAAVAGTVTIDGDTSNNGQGSTNGGPTVIVNTGATVLFTGTQHLSALDILNGGTARMAESALDVLVTGQLNIAAATSTQSGGLLDVADNDMIVTDSGPDALATIQGLLADAYDYSWWDDEDMIDGYIAPAAIDSTIAAADPSISEGLGSAEVGLGQGELNLTSFDNQTVATGDILVKFTYYGDLNLTGSVTAADLQTVENNMGSGLTGWTNGDFNYDGVINSADRQLVHRVEIESNEGYVLPGPITLAADADLPMSGLPTTALSGAPISSWRVNWGNGTTDTFAPTAAVAIPYDDQAATYMATFTPLDPNGDPEYYYPHMNITVAYSTPTIVTATAVSDSQITLNWQYSGTSDGFNIYREDPSTGAYSLIQTVGSGVLQYTDTELAESTTYSYEVTAITSLGESAATTGSASATTVPKAPSNLQVITIDGGSATFTWTNNSATATEAYVDELENGAWSVIGQLSLGSGAAGTPSTLTVSNQVFLPSTLYEFEVSAYSPVSNYSLPSAPCATTTGAFPQTPTDFTAQVGGFALYLQWQSPTYTTDQFTIQYSTDEIHWSLFQTVSGTDGYIDDNFPLGQGDYFRVNETNSFGSSAYTQPQYVYPGDVLPTVAVQATADGVAGTLSTSALTVNLSIQGSAPGIDESDLIYDWTVNGDVTLSVNNTNAAQNTTATLGSAGTFVFECWIENGFATQDPGPMPSSTAAVTVVLPQVLTSISVTSGAASYPSSPATIMPGQIVDLGTVEYDQFGNPMNQVVPLTWSIASGPGTLASDIDGDEYYTAPTAQTNASATVEVSYGSISATYQITVLALDTSQYVVTIDDYGGDSILSGTLTSNLQVVTANGSEAAVEAAVSGTVTVEDPTTGTGYYTATFPADIGSQNGFQFYAPSLLLTQTYLVWQPSAFCFSGYLLEADAAGNGVHLWWVNVTPVTPGAVGIGSQPLPSGQTLFPNPQFTMNTQQTLLVDDYDAQNDGVPDFISGIQNTVGASYGVTDNAFVPLYITVPYAVYADILTAKLQLNYSGSDPKLVTGPVGTDGGYVLPSQGSLRVWFYGYYNTEEEDPNGDGICVGGNYVTPGIEFNLSLLGEPMLANVADGYVMFECYVEAVKPSVQLNDLQIRVYLDTSGTGTQGAAGNPNNLVEVGAVKITAVQPSYPEFNTSSTALIRIDQDNLYMSGQNPAVMSYQGDVNLATGLVSLTTNDLETDGYGLPWGAERTWTDALGIAPAGVAMGNGWDITDWPYLIDAGNGVIAVIGSEVLYFSSDEGSVDSPGSNLFTALFDAPDYLTEANGVFTLTDYEYGDTLEFNGFAGTNTGGSTQANYASGSLIGYENSNAELAVVTLRDDLGNIKQVVRGGDTFDYTYNSTQDPDGNPADTFETLAEMDVYRAGAEIAEVKYAYYRSGSNYGNANDLESASVYTLSDGTLSDGTLTQTAGSYYRYQPSSSSGGGLLLYAVEGADYLMLLGAVGGNPSSLDGASDNLVSQYATEAFAYNTSGTVAAQTIQGAGNVGSNTPGQPATNAEGTYSYQYNPQSNGPFGISDWMYRTTITRPDGNTELVYLNYAGEVMLTDLTTTPSYVTFYSYDDTGALIMTAFPSATLPVENSSAVSTFNSTPDLMGYEGGGQYEGISPSGGLVEYFAYNYYDNGPYVTGEVRAWYQTSIRNDAGTGELLQVYDGVGAVWPDPDQIITFPQNVSDISDADLADARIETYTLFTLPTQLVHGIVTSNDEENSDQGFEGDAVGAFSTELFDSYGNPASETDADGNTSAQDYDPATGAMMESTDGAGDTTQVTAVDAYGRSLQTTDPNNNVTNISYNDSSAVSTVRSTPATGPTTVVLTNWAGGYTETYTVPNGTQGTGAVLSLSVTYFDTAGRTVGTRSYFDLGGITEAALLAGGPFGAVNVNYYSTSDSYDSMGQLSETLDAVGTVTDTTYTPTGWVSTVKVGGTLVTQNVYDNGGPGDGDLTQTTTYVDSNSADNRVTNNYYDYRDRLYATSNGIQLTVYTLDNLGETTETQVYDATQANFVPGANGNPAAATVNASALRAETITRYDNRGLVYEQDVMNVVPQYGSNGQVVSASLSGGMLTTPYWYDGDGNVVETEAPGGLITYYQYDAAGRVTLTQTGGTDSGDTDLGDDSPDGDTPQEAPPLTNPVTSVSTTYDSDGNPTLVATTDNGTDGAAAQTNYVADWYNAANQVTATADYGTNAPPSPLGAAPTASSSTELVTLYTYDADGYLQTTTDPNGVVTWQQNDPLGRPVIVVQNGQSASAYGTNVLPTDYQYNGDNEVTRQTVINYEPGVTSANDTAHTQDQVTIYTYGLYALDQSLLTQVSYSDETSVSYTYNNIGEVTRMADRSGNTHTYTYNAAGELTLDAVTQFGGNVDQAVKALGTTYDTLGDVLSSTSYSNANGTGIINQVAHEYNGYGQVIADYENASGAVSYSTPSVQYAYDQSDNHSRLTGEVYPDGRVVAYGYNVDPTDDEISRIDETSEGTATGSGDDLVITPSSTEETDIYLGDSMVIGRTLPQINVTEVTSLNSFDEVSGLNWIQSRPGTSGADLDQYIYTYDNDGNVLSRDDIGGNSGTDPSKLMEFVYNALGNLTSATTVGASLKSSTTNYSLDSMGNRISTSTSTITNVYDSSNEAANANNVGGNTTKLSDGSTAVYDAWGRVVSRTFTINYEYDYQARTSTATETYTYDALGRLITDTPGGGQTTTTVYDTFDDPVQATTGTTTVQYVWSGADGRIILRDTVGSKRVYALTDAQGSVTSLVDYVQLSGQNSPSWQVAERYAYTADGVASAYDVNWNAVPTAAGSSTIGNYGWTILWQGQVLHGLSLNFYGVTYGHGMYSSLIGENWYDPGDARALSPSPSSTSNGGYQWTNEQLSNDWTTNFGDAFFDPGSFGSAGSVSLNGAFWGTLGFARGALTAGAAIAIGIAVPPLGLTMLAAGIGYGIYDYDSRAGGDSPDGLSPGIGTFADLTGLSAIHEALNDPNLDSYDAGNLLGGGLVQAGAAAYGAASLLYAAPGWFGFEWAFGPEADGNLVLGMGRVLRSTQSSVPASSLFDEVGIRPGENVDVNQISGSDGRSYITYVLVDDDQVVYVGRASGPGTPAEVLASRLVKGHDYFTEGMVPAVISTQGSKLASQGAEEYFMQGYIEQGAPLLNVDSALSYENSFRIQRSLSKLEAFFDEH